MNNLMWSNVFDNFCKTWYVEKGRCSVCGDKIWKTLRLANYENQNARNIDSPSRKHCDICLPCLIKTSEINRIDIFSFLAIRKVISKKTCVICKRNVKRYINIVRGSNAKCLCYNCFVYSNKKTIF